MKKYRLIKKYPGSPKLGSILTLDIKEGDYGTDINNLNVFRHKNEIENHPEFWEEVVEYPIGTKVHNSQTNTTYTKKKDGWYKPAEKTAYTDEMISSKKHLTVLDKSEEIVEKDYMILSFKNDCSGLLYTYHNSGKWVVGEPTGIGDRNYEYCLNYYHIHSVGRISDGEVFTVGDKVDSTISDLGRVTDLTGFKIIDNKLIVGLRHLGYYPLVTIILPKQPLFTTEDGVDIFEGDNYCWINNAWNVSYANYNNVNDTYISFKRFSTAKAAEEYILMNKPCLSYNDVLDIIEKSSKLRIDLVRRLEKLVKSKL